MEYLIGSVGTLLGSLLVLFIINKNSSRWPQAKLTVRQSRNYLLIKDYLVIPHEHKLLKTQATDYFDKTHSRVAIVDDKAYWIQNNALLCADIVDGIVDEESTKVVDTMALDDVELKKMILVVDKLTEGTTDDSRNSGDSQL